ncbi:glutamine amidotransferase [Acidipropionibacterium virtanenii]|uniref:GMP synthase [glutamine-hydrolyzing] n=1 Tax=Acidipropionibacterium virtanenii TaxID=2057246 RepID=A0A344USB7_9ACTN|nr:glutamine amidotransferase [Acidipropionibacterium virtanenii]AXE38165.1 GMP synthase [glutamine-hydrolyzing] [Acidipropionibacterium virtanenii]
MPTAIALRHVHFEDLGVLEPVLRDAGYGVRYVDVADETEEVPRLDPDLLIVLGAPVGAEDVARYPWLIAEEELLRRRTGLGAPVLGICLGAQLLALATGGHLVSGGSTEIGYAPVELTEAGLTGPLRHLRGTPVLHWHGDRFTTPPGAELLAGTRIDPDQGFSIGAAVLGLQFHVEADPAHIERWLIGHAHELAAVGVDPDRVRQDARQYGESLTGAARAMMREWLSGL